MSLHICLILLGIFGFSNGGVMKRSEPSYDSLKDIFAAAYGGNIPTTPRPLTTASTTKKMTLIDSYIRGDYLSAPRGAAPISSGDDSSYIKTTGGSSTNSLNCREFSYSAAKTQAECAAVTDRQINPQSSTSTPGYCRWVSSDKLCMCPTPQYKCQDITQCYWNKASSLTGYFAAKDTSFPGECISNAERFYIILASLLSKRGKKDFAIRINYSSAPARGQLPIGPYGPAVIGGGTAYRNNQYGFGLPINSGSVMPGMPMGYMGSPMFGYGGYPGYV